MASRNDGRFNIVSGPSKFDIMTSLFDSTGRRTRTVEFRLEGDKDPIIVAIEGIRQEDGSGESWLFSGESYQDSKYPKGPVKGYYSSWKRTGVFEFVEEGGAR